MENYSSISASKKGVPTNSCSCSSFDEQYSHSVPSHKPSKIIDLNGIKSENSRKSLGEDAGPLGTCTNFTSTINGINDLGEVLPNYDEIKEIASDLGATEDDLREIERIEHDHDEGCACHDPYCTGAHEVTESPPVEFKKKALPDELSKMYKIPDKFSGEKYDLQYIAKYLMPEERVHDCLRVPVPGVDAITVHRSKEYGRYFYGNLTMCGSVWMCPVCAAKIGERRRKELSLLFERHRERGGYVLMVTLTFPHQFGDKLQILLDKLKEARSRFTNGGGAKRTRERVGCIGTVRALEVTHGNNGWHPHIHELWLLDGSVLEEKAREYLEKTLYKTWKRGCLFAGLPKPSEKYGLDIRNGSHADKYVAKWGLESEMTKSYMKRGRKGGQRTPWDLLRSVHTYNDSQSKRLFIEYATAFKGKRQLFWSRGLRDRYEMGKELKDEELAALKQEYADVVGRIPLNTWWIVVKNKLVGTLLRIGELGGWSSIQAVLDDLCEHEAEKIDDS